MAYKRKRSSTRNYSRKRARTTRRRSARSRVPRGVRMGKTHMFKRVVKAPPITLSWNAPTYWSYAFKFNDLQNYHKFQSLYDLFRVNKLKVMIVPNFTGLDGGNIPVSTETWHQGNAGLNATGPFKQVYWLDGAPNIHSVVDYDSISLIDNIPDLMQYSTYRMTRGTRMHSRYWTPAVIMGTESECDPDGTVARTPTTQKFRPWLDTATGVCVPHYGLKLAIDKGPMIQTILGNHVDQSPVSEVKCRVYVTAYFECKGVRYNVPL